LLPYADNTFDIIYGISVFTHLPLEKHYEWKDELARVLKKGGIILFTTQGDNYMRKLTAGELKVYYAGELVTRGNSAAGHRTFSTFHPPMFVNKLFEGMQLLDHIVYEAVGGGAPPQDVWIFRK
jgi:SAM-dependent methyltransferase